MIQNNLFRLTLILLTGFSSISPLFSQSIALARLQPIGSTITVRGLVTSGAELGKIRYLQDASAGIAAFPGSGSVPGFEAAVQAGDSIEVTGTLVDYFGLLEITPITSFTVISSGNPLPSPKQIKLSELDESLESMLVEFNCVSMNSPGGVFNAGTYQIHDQEGESSELYFRSSHPLLGTPRPELSFRLRAIVSDYLGYQLLPRYTSDLDEAGCFYFVQQPRQSNLQTNGFQLNWQTSLPASCTVHFGASPAPNQMIQVPGANLAHQQILSTLNPGSIYWIQVTAQNNGLTIYSPIVPMVTAATSSGQIKTYFNNDIDPAYANGNVPDGQTDDEVVAEIINRINQAQQTLDIAMYNNNRADLTNAVKAAHTRGVRVRYVAAFDGSNNALDPPPNFPVVYGNDLAIMHHKFMVIDADLPNQCWVMSGAMNWTNQNIQSDFNNILFIQDQSLARTYELEFEEMWGSEGPTPDVLKSRFGAAKTNNTPHLFLIGGREVESYFSPSDQTTTQIERVLRSAQSEALFATFSFTRNELGQALVDVHQNGVPVRGIMENISDAGAEYDFLLDNGVAVKHHNLPGEFHHKYAVIDAYDLNSDPVVLTGSHNWSTAAETVNDENTLIIHDPAIAALFKAEFEKRWGSFPVAVHQGFAPAPRVYPNPASQKIRIEGLDSQEFSWIVSNTLGQQVMQGSWTSTDITELNLGTLLPGQYWITVISSYGVTSIPIQKI
ncbi:MAG TPA: phospholipase D-like domain-containing protein [Saprospiraceae bacterium]|nr:phospholipase D-like domain-containing protein [Saprospiraceae bacterium]